jgi:hypothetical protein
MKFDLLKHNGVEVDDYPAEGWFLAPFPSEKGRPFNADNLATVNLAPFLSDPDFQNALRAAESRWNTTQMERDISWRLHVFLSLASASLRRQGDGGFVELGLGRGFMVAALRVWERSQGCHFTFHHVFDRPAGSDDPPMYAHGVDEISSFCDSEGVQVFWGDLPETLEQRKVSDLESARSLISFVHVDLNHGALEVECLEQLKPFFSPNCILLFDDSGNPGCQDQAERHEAWCLANGRHLCFLPTGQAFAL